MKYNPYICLFGNSSLKFRKHHKILSPKYNGKIEHECALVGLVSKLIKSKGSWVHP